MGRPAVLTQVNDEDRETCAGLQAAVFAPWVQRIAREAADALKSGAPAWDPPSVSLLDMELERRQVSTLFSAPCHIQIDVYG